MSGILGHLALDGRPAGGEVVTRMAAQSPARGADGFALWEHGEVALGHQMLRTTPESLTEVQPAILEPRGLALTWDGTLYNRDEIQRKLRDRPGARPGELGHAPDSTLVLHAWAAWGEACLEELAGDYAFALWDTGKRELFAATDIAGLRPLHYSLSPQAFLFASEEIQLLAAPWVSRELEPWVVRAFLEDMYPAESSVFRAIRRLPGGHALRVAGGAVSVRRYWHPPSERTRFKRREEYAERFRELFAEATRARLRANGPVGCWVSGGLDSSSVASMAAAGGGRDALRCQSAVFPGLACDESEFARSVSLRHGLAHRFVPVVNERLLETAAAYLGVQATPFLEPNIVLFDRLLAATREDGCRVFLTGSAGDIILGWELALEDELRRLRLASWWRELHAVSRNYERSASRTAVLHLKAAAPAPLRSLGALRRRLRPRQDPRLALARPVEGEPRARERPEQSAIAPWPRWPVAREGFMAVFYGHWNRISSGAGLEMRDPFLDRRVIEFMFSVPNSLYLRDGLAKAILRESLSDILPDKVRTRTAKAEFSPFLHQGLRQLGAGALRRALGGELASAAFLRKPVLDAWVEEYLRGGDAPLWSLWYGVSLELWLRNFWPAAGPLPSPASGATPRIA